MVITKKIFLIILSIAFCLLSVKVVSARAENSSPQNIFYQGNTEDIKAIKQAEPEKEAKAQVVKCSFPDLENEISEIEKAIINEKKRGDIERAQDLLSQLEELKRKLEEKKTDCRKKEKELNLEGNLKKLEQNLKKEKNESQSELLKKDEENIEKIIRKIDKEKASGGEEPSESQAPEWFESKWESGIIKRVKIKRSIEELKKSKCLVPDSLLKKLKNLMWQAETAKEAGNTELEKEVNQKITNLKQEIEKRKQDCEEKVKINLPSAGGGIVEKIPLPNMPGYANLCELAKKELKEIEKEILSNQELLSSLLSLSSKEEKATETTFGFNAADKKKEITERLKKLKEKKAKLLSVIAECEGKNEPEREGIIIKKVGTPENDKEISAYYREKIADIMKKKASAEEKIKQLKEAKKEIDKMIKELIKTKKEFSLEEIRPIINEIFKIQPGLIRVGGTEITNQAEKEISFSLKKKPIKLKTTPKNIYLKQEDVEVDVRSPLEIGKEKIMLKGKEIKLTPKEALLKAKVRKPIKFELLDKDKKLAYKIKTVEKKRLFFIFPVRVEKEILIDAENDQGNKIGEKKPWWSFLAW